MEGQKQALITGITGQDGSYLTEYLISLGYSVHGIVRRHSLDGLPLGKIIERHKNVYTHYGDLQNSEQVVGIFNQVDLDEVYHLGAQSHVGASFDVPEHTGNVVALGTTRILEAIRRCCNPDVRMYNAATSEMFGLQKPPQSEITPFHPRSPYACAKLYGYWMVTNYRNGYNIHASNGVLFNHESGRRGDNFVTRKITKAVANILAKKQDKLILGDLSAKRDWGFAPEYVMVMHKMLQQDQAGDYVIGTGETHTVSDFVREVFAYVDLDVDKYVHSDPMYMRPTDVDELCADTTKSRKVLGWKPKIKMKELSKIMVDADMRAAGLEVFGDGDKIIKNSFKEKWWYGD